jgi:transcriptional regulator with XRE-family HTH domain
MHCHKLTQYLSDHGVSRAAFCELVGTSQAHLGRLLSGQARPGVALALRIESLTLGKVRAEDWCDPDELCLPPRRRDAADTTAEAA